MNEFIFAFILLILSTQTCFPDIKSQPVIKLFWHSKTIKAHPTMPTVTSCLCPSHQPHFHFSWPHQCHSLHVHQMSSDFVIHPPNKTPTSTCLLSALQRITYPLPRIFCQIVVLCFCFPFVNTEPCSHKLSHACILYFSSIPVTNGPSVNSILTRDSCLSAFV